MSSMVTLYFPMVTLSRVLLTLVTFFDIIKKEEVLSVNERLKTLRKSLNLTLEEFGKKVGVTKTAISRLEKGERNLTDQMILSICREFNVNEKWLRTGEGDMDKDLDAEFADVCFKIGVHDEKAKKVIMNYWKLSNEDKELFWTFLDKLTK